MYSLKLKTTSGTHREVDLIDYGVLRRNADSVFDDTIELDDGSEVLYQKARRRAYDISVNGITAAMVDTLDEIFRDRQEVYFEANMGQYTALYHPFESSKNPYYGGIGAFARASVATYTGADGLIREMAAGSPRFEAGKIGNGIILEMARTNYIYPSHGASGSTIWTAHAGSPSVAWDTSVASNVYGKAGTIRLEVTSATPDVVKATISGLTASTTYCAYVWAIGVGSLALSVTDATGTTTSGTVTLSMTWQRIAVEGFITTGTSVDLRITAVGASTRCWLSAHQVEAGQTYTSYIPTTAATVTRAMDQIAFTPALNYGEGSIAMWVKFPRTSATFDGTRKLFYLSTYFYGDISTDGTIYFVPGNGVSISANAATHGITAGTWFHLAYVWKRDYAAIVVNGVAVANSTSTTRETGVPGVFYLYNGSSAPHTVIDDLRIDSRYVEWRTSESGLYRPYGHAGNLSLRKQTQGRKFRIKNAALTHREADPATFDGTLTIKEISSDTLYTVGDK